MESTSTAYTQEGIPLRSPTMTPRVGPLQEIGAIGDSSFHHEELLSRSPTRSLTLASLPEDQVSSPAPAQVNIATADFAHPSRQLTDSSTSTSSNGFELDSSRNSGGRYPNPSSQTRPTATEVQLCTTQFEAIKSELETVPTPHQNQNPRMPTNADLEAFQDIRNGLSWKIRDYRNESSQSAVDGIIVILHGHGGDHDSIKPFAKKHLQSGILCLGGIRRLSPVAGGPMGGLDWADEPHGQTFKKAIELILRLVIGKVLIETCNFAPRNIAILGHGQGGSLALAISSVWDTIRLGGIITIDGPPPEYIPSPQVPQNPTPVLIIGGKLGPITRSAEQKTKDLFLYVDQSLRSNVTTLPVSALVNEDNSDEIIAVNDFLKHSLRQEEWETQTVLTFDGGGIRGYGSLLIVKELMRRIGLEEKRLDSRIESSFYPSIYKPRLLPRPATRPATASSQAEIVATPTVDDNGKELEESARFLPCHYFNYIGGTSTGGLISIMLSRFRMTVNDCLEEYKLLGGRVFAHPRPLATGGILWHRFDYRDLEDVIQDVTNRHCFQKGPFLSSFAMDPDFSRTVVLAYSEEGTTDAPYMFRTYPQFRHPTSRPGTMRRPTTLALKNVPIHNPGNPSHARMVEVGRATSAAPTYFPPVRISVPSETGGERRVRFKDGGFGSNNPSFEIFNDVVRKHGNYRKKVSIFISIGTGYSELRMFDKEGPTRAITRFREFLANLKAARKLPARTKGAHDNMLAHANSDNEAIFQYSRFEGPPDLGKIELSEWKSGRLSSMMKGMPTFSGKKTLQEIENAVKIYLAEPDIQRELDDRARLLVQRKRLRMRDKSRWDRYASASWYECPLGTCGDAKSYPTYISFEEHVRAEHQHDYVSADFESFAQIHRRCWLYEGS